MDIKKKELVINTDYLKAKKYKGRLSLNEKRKPSLDNV